MRPPICPSFPHPVRAAYVLGPERGVLTPSLPRAASISFASPPPSRSMSPPPAPSSCTTGLRSLGRFASRPVAEGAGARARSAACAGRPTPRKAAAGLTGILAKGKSNLYASRLLTKIGDGEMHRAVRATLPHRWRYAPRQPWRKTSTLLDKFKDWSAYAAAGTPKVCFAVAKPKQHDPQEGSSAARSISTFRAGPPTT